MTDGNPAGGALKFDELLQDEQPFDDDSLPDGDPTDATEPNPGEDVSQVDENEHGDPENTLGGFQSSEELVQAYQTLENMVQEKARETEDLRQLLGHLEHQATAAMKGHQENAFLNHIRGVYDQDPVSATEMMIRKFQEDALNDFDSRMHQRLQQEQDHRRFMNDFLNHPSNAGLKPHENELESLIRDHGVPPHSAAEIIRNVESRKDRSSTRRSDAARAVRNRSMVESPGEVGEPVNKDQEFDRVLQKAKTLDEMFAGLRKLKL
jgi:hypothetical protein